MRRQERVHPSDGCSLLLRRRHLDPMVAADRCGGGTGKSDARQLSTRPTVGRRTPVVLMVGADAKVR